MTKYERLLDVAYIENVIVKEKPLYGTDGLAYGNRIAIRNNIPTTKEKACVLAEELGHYYTSTGDIINLQDVGNRKQELHARVWGYNQLIGLIGLIKAFEHRCRNLYEMAEYLNITEEYLQDALKYYRSKYGIYTTFNQYIIYFEPTFSIAKIL